MLTEQRENHGGALAIEIGSSDFAYGVVVTLMHRALNMPHQWERSPHVFTSPGRYLAEAPPGVIAFEINQGALRERHADVLIRVNGGERFRYPYQVEREAQAARDAAAAEQARADDEAQRATDAAAPATAAQIIADAHAEAERIVTVATKRAKEIFGKAGASWEPENAKAN